MMKITCIMHVNRKIYLTLYYNVKKILNFKSLTKFPKYIFGIQQHTINNILKLLKMVIVIGVKANCPKKDQGL